LLIAFEIKSFLMKNIIITLMIASSFVVVTCKKDELSDRFKYLTGTVWVADSLLSDGIEVGGVGGLLENFNGDLTFNPDGTGKFGVYKGTWELTYGDTEIILTTDSLAFPVVTQVEELTKNSLKVTTGFPDALNPGHMLNIRMTFKSKE
jgi:hypothetical protein